MDDAAEKQAAELNAAVRDALLTHLRSQKAPWEKLKQSDQQDAINAIEQTAREVIRHAVDVVSSRGFDSMSIVLKDLNIKDGRIKGKFEAQMTGDNVTLLAEHENQRAMIVLAEAVDFMQGDPANADPDEPEMQMGHEPDRDDQRRAKSRQAA